MLREGRRGTGERGERSLLKKLRKTFMKRGYGYSLCKSDCFPIWFRPSPQEIVLGRLTRVIRRLFEAIAVISKGASAFYGEELRDIVFYIMVANRTILGMER